jgi:membrane-bound serine protease (ClpP class)
MDMTYLTLGALLIGAGLLLLLVALFVPSGGLLIVLALAAVAVGLGMLFEHDTTAGLYALGAAALVLPALGTLLLYLWPRTPLGRQLFPPPSPGDDTLASLAVNQELAGLKGRYGKALSALRPSGVVDFDGRRVDALTEGMMVEPGRWVRCVATRAGTVIVRPVDGPGADEQQTATFH